MCQENKAHTIQSAYKEALQANSDEILYALIEKNNRKLQQLSGSSAPENLAEAESLYETIAVSTEILKERKQIREARTKEARKKKQQETSLAWKKQLQFRQKSAVRNLEYAVCFEGQLIAAILEEEGPKGPEELKNWCEELKKLDETRFKECLEGLADENIIRKTEDNDNNENNENHVKYELISVLNDRLFPEDGERFVKVHMEKAGIYPDEKEAALLTAILGQLNKEKFGMDAGQIFDALKEKNDIPAEEADISLWLEKLKKAGALSSSAFDGLQKYYYPMLGEK